MPLGSEPSLVIALGDPKSVPKVRPKCTKSNRKVYQKCMKSVTNVFQKCTGSVRKVYCLDFFPISLMVGPCLEFDVWISSNDILSGIDFITDSLSANLPAKCS